MRLVLKFGGTSLSSPNHIRNVAKIVASFSKDNEIVVVCSAVDGTTDDLLTISRLIEEKKKDDVTKALNNIIKKHKQFANQTVKNSAIRKQLIQKLNTDVSELKELVRGLTLLKEVSARSLDYLISFGERLSDDLVSFALQDIKKKSTALNGKEVGIVTDSNFGESRPLMDTTRIRISKTLGSLLAKKIIPVVGGFAGADQHGNITTFGRGGSDYTATIIASCINADEIWLMSDVDGLMTADPKLVKNAKLLNNYDWLASQNYIDFLREIGGHFSVNRMLSFDSVKTRLEREQNLSFLEFNYMILQGYDFYKLNENYNCILQMGGSDQWGNIICGIDLTRRLSGKETYGLTTPLLTTSSGQKMGKTEDIAKTVIFLIEDDN